MGSYTSEAIDHQVELRLRFKKSTSLTCEEVMNRLKEMDMENKFHLKISDNYAWLTFKKKYQKIYTPQLQIRVDEDEYNEGMENEIHFLFGPDSGLWTMFMFLHFGIALGLISCGIWLYTNLSLEKSAILPTSLIAFFVVAWIGLYFWARSNRAKGKPQAKLLERKVKQSLDLSSF